VLPLQDVVPTGRVPVATLALIVANVTVVMALSAGVQLPDLLARPFAHPGPGPFVVALVMLWLFGDNVEARLRPLPFLALYLAIGAALPLGATGAVTAILGAYFVLLPNSKVLMLVPAPLALAEVPAVFFLGVWLTLHVLRFVPTPPALWGLGLALALGALTARLVGRRVSW
jgi:membrane associated rhomboid family serine protease